MVYENEDDLIHKCTECELSCDFCGSRYCEYDNEAMAVDKYNFCPDCAEDDILVDQIKKELPNDDYQSNTNKTPQC